MYTKDIPLSEKLALAFWIQVARDQETGCLFWMGTIEPQGYGLLRMDGTNYYRAHRVGYCLHYGITNLPSETPVLDHLCCVRPCVEWSHLEAVTVSVNTLRGRSPQLVRARRLRTHCRAGHALEGRNLVLQSQGRGWIRQRCRICMNAYSNAAMKQRRLRRLAAGMAGDNS